MNERALLFTDVVDSTRLGARLGDRRAAELWTAHDDRARGLLARYHGREIGRADGFFLLFDDPTEAARYAIAYHQALGELGFTARAGLHVGPVRLPQNPSEAIARGAISTEVVGLAMPITARVMALARGGQTLLTASARHAFGEALPEGASRSHGYYASRESRNRSRSSNWGWPIPLPFSTGRCRQGLPGRPRR
jgi:class 3 adenylate cyclase